jgi:hypothetical protein
LQLAFLFSIIEGEGRRSESWPDEREGQRFVPVTEPEEDKIPDPRAKGASTMQPLKGLVWGCALAALTAIANPVHAGWNNVFQVCCNNCGTPAAPVVANAVDPCCPAPPPTRVCTTRYIQRTYYQPVTTYRQSTYYEPVTTYRTSYFYEPVCSYRYSCYFDPCTCRYQTVATPVTSYRLRSQCCPVTTYLQRCCMTPVTTYRAMCYYEPVTTCCDTPGGTPAPASQETTDSLPGPPPSGTRPPVGSKEERFPSSGDSSRPDVMPPANLKRNSEKPLNPRIDRIASRDGQNIDGRVVDGGRQALAGAKVLFVNVERKSDRHTATADRSGNFRAELSEGAWLVYTHDDQGKPVFSRRVEVPAGRSIQLTLVSR